jgi:hypothetical protein
MIKIMSTPLAIYSPKRTYLVNTVGTNYLVRGNEPLNESGAFAYDELNEKLQTLIPDFNLKNNKLITISLIDNNPASERSDLNKEFLAYGISQEDFDKYLSFPNTWPPFYRGVDVKAQSGTTVCGQSGAMVWYPVQGCSDENNCELVEAPQFNFSGLVDYMQALITTEENVVVYYHCEHGHDRTSALTGAYMLKYMGKTLEDVLTERPPNGAKAFSHPWGVTYEQLVKYYYSILSKK